MMWHLIAGYLLVGLALVCLEPGIEAMDTWTARRGMIAAITWATPIWEVLEWCCSVSRNPDGQPTTHIGG